MLRALLAIVISSLVLTPVGVRARESATPLVLLSGRSYRTTRAIA